MTNDQKEAIRQALDAMASARSLLDTDRQVLIDCNTDGDGRLDEDAQFDVDVYAYAIGAIDAAADRLARVMRESSESGGLRNAAQAALDWIEAQPHPRMLGAFDTAEQLRAALAEQEAEPVAWMSMSDDGSDLLSFAKPADDPRPVPLYAHPPSSELTDWIDTPEEVRP